MRGDQDFRYRCLYCAGRGVIGGSLVRSIRIVSHPKHKSRAKSLPGAHIYGGQNYPTVGTLACVATHVRSWRQKKPTPPPPRVLHQKWLTLDIHNPFQNLIDLNFSGKSYENFPILSQGLRAQDCHWRWLQSTFCMGHSYKISGMIPLDHYHDFWYCTMGIN